MFQSVPYSPYWTTRRALLKILIWICLLAFAAVCFGQSDSPNRIADSALQQTHQTIRLDVFIRSDKPTADKVVNYVEALRRKTPGLEIAVHDVLEDKEQLRRLYRLAQEHGVKRVVVPAFLCCDRMYFGFTSPDDSGPNIEQLFTADVYTRRTCSRCRAGKLFIKEHLEPRWPALRFKIYEVESDPEARQRWQALCRGAGQVPGLPTFEFAGKFLIGYQGDSITGKQWEQMIADAAQPAQSAGPAAKASEENETTDKDQTSADQPDGVPQGQSLGQLPARAGPNQRLSPLRLPLQASVFGSPAFTAATLVGMQEDEIELPEDALDLQLPDEAEYEGFATEPTAEVVEEVPLEEQSIRLPVFGEIRVAELGLPVFTLAVGLIDGFNPCAMWILVFLLSVLVNIPDRRKIIAIAGTFVLVSGIAYFAFMAAWLNLFVLIGIARPVQILLGLMALFFGVVNIKDFFAFKKGISLSIPESQRPGLIKRVRKIVTAKYLTVAIAGAVGLAVVVNLVELLCTAGLPALYTQILMMHELAWWQNYLYLALYIAAYMFDDSMLLAVAVATLSHHKLQEKEGRWLKLISGVVILLLGLVMLIRPEWLQLGH